MGPIQGLTAVLFLLLDICAGQRMVTIQKGRLYRTKGYHITIWCNVSGYGGPLEQTFQWSVYQASTPQIEWQLISTSDSNFPYAVYGKRVRRGEIYVERIHGDSVLLHITNLLDEDAGEYECHTPSTDEGYLGTYSAKTNLSVIPDTLSATMEPQDLIHNEGDSLELICEVSTATAQHVHLSVAWYLIQGDGEVQEILSLSRDFVLIAGSSYKQRVSSGDIRLDKIGDKKYKLSIVKILPSDQGKMYCEAVEWIQDPDETWKDIARKRTKNTSLTVRSLVLLIYLTCCLLFIESRLKLILWVNEERIIEGAALNFHCNASVAGNSLSVKWWHISKDRSPPVLIANMDQEGTLKIGSFYLEHSARGDLRLEKVDSSTFTLTIYNTSATDDSGLYRCEVTEWFKGRSWKHAQDISANIEPLGMNLKAVLIGRVANVKLHEDFELYCKVSINHSTNEVPMSIIWLFHPSSALSGYQQVVKITAGGTVEWGSALLHFHKKTKITKSSSSSRLLIHGATWQDAGIYKCEVEVRKSSQQARDLGTEATAVASSNPVEIKVTQPESKLRVSLDTKGLELSTNDATEIKCEIISLNKEESQLGVSWYFQPLSLVDTVPLLILATNYSNIVEYGEAFSSPQKKFRFHSKKVSSHLYQLYILSVEPDVSGIYYCVVEEWIWSVDSGWHNLGKMESGRTTVSFKPSERKLHIESTNHSIIVTENDDVTLKCLLKSQIHPTSHFSISWFKVSNHSNNEALLKIKDNGIIEYGNGKMARRLHPHCPSTGNFYLTIQNVEAVDSGLFYCQVEEWALNCSTAQVLRASVESGHSEVCYSASLFHFLLFYPLVMFLILMAAILFLCFKIKSIQQKQWNLKTKQEFCEETGLVEPTHQQLSGKRSNSIGKEETSSLKGSVVD
ncbi:immunoglobulin superfamily member 2-like [Eublepharis macularius]|uniref:immunoglobulin superfamily member 2-like n=1 Tax=Eublepharis macularius TaxID=481883 RepID=UPI00240E9E7E|nr:immunoglobulin superfamily member 2-like [Eublepharis macularius]